MSNVIKNGEYTYEPNRQTVVLVLHVPLIDTGHASEQKRIKMLEEIDELLNEFARGPVDDTKAMEELHDVIQVMAGYILAKAREETPYLNPVERTKNKFEIGSALHHTKMKFRSAERGWVVLTE